MQFCPTCSNMLQVGTVSNMGYRFYCQTCPYVHTIDGKISRKIKLDRKVIDDVLGGEEAWKNVDSTEGLKP